ncbi:response regulator [Ferrovibrio sp.]|uniref:response regulator n=1 Tax=Ferrovibrio sp. TaxID=1917215 RepID=UPI003D298206
MAEARIIVVDDEAGIREMLAEYLSGHGFVVRAADGAAHCRRLLAEEAADLVVLDINMPGEDGLSLARWLRGEAAFSSIGIVMLTAESDVVDRVVGLEVGADDYVTKPFDLRELRARIRTVLRRVQPVAAAQAAEKPAAADNGEDVVRFGQRLLNLGSRKLYDGAGGEIPLTAMEFDLLQAFARHPDRVLSRDQLLDLAHHGQWEPFDRSIDIRVARLRRKIEADPSHPAVLKTVHGAGYLFDSQGGR